MALCQLDQKSALDEIAALIQGVAKLYQIPNFDEINAFLLSEWVYDEYAHRDLALIQDALRKPPVIRDPATGAVTSVWRLTPDTLKNWIDLRSIEREIEKERILSRERQEKPIQLPPAPEHVAIDVDKLINEKLNELKNDLLKGALNSVPQITDQQVREEGQTRPKASKYKPDPEYYSEWRAKMKSLQERTVRERHPEASEEEITKFLKTIEPK